MPRRRWLILGVALAVVLIGGLVGLIVHFETLPQRLSRHETIVLGQSRLAPGSTAAMRVVVRDSRDAAALPGAAVKVLLKPAQGGAARTVYEGETDGAGTLAVTFAVPEDAAADQTLIVETASSLGRDRTEQPVTIVRDYRLLVTTDKPLYQPGQLIHIRALALGSFDQTPASDQAIDVAVADGKGNIVFRKSLNTTSFGVAATDFQLANEVNSGPYKITAALGNTVSEKTVTVEHYTLPKFDVTLTTDRAFYRPGDTVQGSLTARYFFGKDVAAGSIAIEGYTYDVDRVVAVTVEGMTDAQGAFDFSFRLPTYVVGSELEDGRARFYVEARVTDQAQHTEVGRLSLPVATSSLVIDAIPEAAQFRQGVENILYVMASYPDGAPAQADITVSVYDTGQSISARTGPYGLAEVRFTPQNPYVSLAIAARDDAGATAQREFSFEGIWTTETVLLRPDGAIYRVGDMLGLSILTSQPRGTVYLDIVREGQTVSTRAVDVVDGRADVAVDLAPELYGTLELHAYKILSDGSIVRDTRLVVVDQADDLDVALTVGAETYRPGENATLDVDVRDGTGSGVSSAVGLAIVDESVFALAEQDPGFAKLYFMLEQELLEPKFELHGFSIPEMISSPCGADGAEACSAPLDEAREGVGKAALASAVSELDPFTLQANSRESSLERARTLQVAFYRTLAGVAFWGAVTIPLGVFTANAVAIARARRLWGSLGLALGLLFTVGLSLLGLLWIHDRLPWSVQRWSMAAVAAVAGLLGVVGLVVLLVAAVRRCDRLLGITLATAPLVLAVGLVAAWAGSRADVFPEEWVLVLSLIAVLALPLTFLLRGAGFLGEKRIVHGIAAVAAAVLLLGPAVVVVSIGATSPRGLVGGEGMDREFALANGAAPMLMVVEEMAFEDEKAVEAPAEPMPTGAGEAVEQASEPPRLRQYFPETMFWLPEGITNAEGHLSLTFPVADSITTWRVAALASSQDGRLGSATGALRVFQDFFIDLDLPGSLTVGDEISVPVAVYNYLTESQTVRLEVQPEPWFEILDATTREIAVEPNEITVVYFRIQTLAFGQQPFQVTATGSRMSDAIRRDVRVFPDGKELRFSISDKLSLTVPAEATIQIPADAIAGTQRLTVKIYPGVVSQVVEGLDALLRMPFGCFEQTSSTTYPNVLVLDYLKTTGQVSPEVRMKAEEYINLGYQRLTTFEVAGDPGGFSLFGDAPADPMLTAYGLQEFSDMSRVAEVDGALIERIAEWLFRRQDSDGSWQGVEGFHETSITSLTGRIPVTAWIVWGLADAGYVDHSATQRGASYLRENASGAENAYDLAMVANALVAVDTKTGGITESTAAVLDRLAGMAKREGESATWDAGRETYMGGYGTSGQLETTASAALAFLRAGRQPDLANAALTYLVRGKDSFGTWETTSATVMALKAFIESVRSGAEDTQAEVAITLDGGQNRTVQVTPETFDVVQFVVYDDVPVGQDIVVAMTTEGEGNLMYQVTTSYFLPWESLGKYPDLVSDRDLVTIDVHYDRTALSVDDTVGVDVTVTMNEPAGAAEQSIIDLGLPPGFTVETEDLDRLVTRFTDVPEDYPYAQVKRYELTGRQIILYVTNLSGAQPLSFSYRLRARFPLVAQTPSSAAYDYYNPSTAAEVAPVTLTVTGE